MTLGRIDPWLESQVRLAQDRGSLVAPNSMVQDWALRYLSLSETQRRSRERVEALKLALLPHEVDRQRLANLFPEYFPKDAFADAVREDGTLDEEKVDETQLDWSTVEDPLEDADISRWIADREHGQISAADLDDDWR